MNSLDPRILLFFGPFALGVAAALLMFIMFTVASTPRNSNSKLQDFRNIILWFLGNESIVIGPLYLFNLDESFGWPMAKAVAFLSFLVGFGVSAGLASYHRLYGFKSKRSIATNYLYECLKKHFSSTEVDILLFSFLENGFNPSKSKLLDKAAKRFGMSRQQLESEYMKVLQKIYEIGVESFQSAIAD